MRIKKEETYVLLSQVSDMVLVGLAFWVSYLLTPHAHEALAGTRLGEAHGIWLLPDYVPGHPLSLENYFWTMAVIIPGAVIVLEKQGFYKRPTVDGMWRSVTQFMMAVLVVALCLGAGIVFFKTQAPPLVFLVLLIVITRPLLLAKKAIWQNRL